jgi:ribosomal protein S18 acetylase RimI-like enzyme
MNSPSVRCIDSDKDPLLLSRLAEISERAFSNSIWGDSRAHRSILSSIIDSNGSSLWVAELCGKICGFTFGEILTKQSIQRVDDTKSVPLRAGDYLLSWTAIDPEYQGNRVASELFAHRMNAARAHSRIVAVTRLNNFKMTRLYRSSGLQLYKTINRFDLSGKPCAYSWFVKETAS